MNMILKPMLTLGLIAFVTTNARSENVPKLINYQGFLEQSGSAANGDFTVILRLYNMQSGGTALFADSNTVTVTDGLYSTLIGDDPVFGTMVDALTNSSVWVEIEVDGTVLTPRERLVSSAYAIRAAPQVSFRASTSGGAVPESTVTNVNFSTEHHDDGNNFTTGDGAKFTAPTDGVYFFQAAAGLEGLGLHRRPWLGLAVNGTVLVKHKEVVVGTYEDPLGAHAASAVLRLNAGDEVQVKVWQDSGVIMNLVQDGTRNWFSGYQIY